MPSGIEYLAVGPARRIRSGWGLSTPTGRPVRDPRAGTGRRPTNTCHPSGRPPSPAPVASIDSFGVRLELNLTFPPPAASGSNRRLILLGMATTEHLTNEGPTSRSGSFGPSRG